MLGDPNDVLARIGDRDLVLDVGGWACPFNRADWVMDSEPYGTRGFYGSIGLPASQGGAVERFTRETWVQRDICARDPWPFADKQFDFSICSHTLEDLRDPLGVCSELVRVSKAGYIEVPSRLWETCRGMEHPRMAGLSHHRWLVEARGGHLEFTQKYHLIHAEYELAFPVSFGRALSTADSILRLFWEGSFTFSERTIHGAANIRESMAGYVRARYRYPGIVTLGHRMGRAAERVARAVSRRLSRA